ncbi:MAG: NAD-dependent epimerase/dehydratase family protein [Pseudomonadota bacterium]
MANVLLTGASGFLAKHIALRLLQEGHSVRASLRNPARQGEVIEALTPRLPPGAIDRLSFVTLDLTRDAGWIEALGGCDALVHTASPFPIAQPKDPDTLIRPAVDGTRRALTAARAAGVDRVVLTSSTVAILSGSRDGRIHTEDDWADSDGPPAQPYARSKVMAEREAWAIAGREGLWLTTINPSFILGPPLDAHFGSSIGLVRRLLRGRDPMLPRIGFPVVDVRDVALAHVRALDRPEAEGQRIIASSGSLWLPDWGRILKAEWPDRRIPTRTAPKALLRILALFDAEIRASLPAVGHMEQVSAEKARRLLGIDFIPPDAALIAAGRELVARGLV